MPSAIRRIHSDISAIQLFQVRHQVGDPLVLHVERCGSRAIRVDSNRKSRLALVLQVGFLRMTGTTLDTYEYIPRSVLECVAMQLKVRAPMLATLRALSRRVMTRHRHQNWACRYLGISRMTVADEETLCFALVMAYNAGQLQQSLDAEVASGADRPSASKHRSMSDRSLTGTSIFAAPIPFRSTDMRLAYSAWLGEATNSAATRVAMALRGHRNGTT
jgi:hypothetical protein